MNGKSLKYEGQNGNKVIKFKSVTRGFKPPPFQSTFAIKIHQLTKFMCN